MGFQDAMNYILFSNPISKGTTDLIKYTVNTAVPSLVNKTKDSAKSQDLINTKMLTNLARVGSPFTRIAGISGATAVALGAYGAHAFSKGSSDELKKIFELSNRFHFLHSLALMGVPLCRYPKTSGTFLLMGMFFFCGTCYYHALTGNSQFRQLTPIGGTCLIIGWMCMVF